VRRAPIDRQVPLFVVQHSQRKQDRRLPDVCQFAGIKVIAPRGRSPQENAVRDHLWSRFAWDIVDDAVVGPRYLPECARDEPAAALVLERQRRMAYSASPHAADNSKRRSPRVLSNFEI